MVETLKDSGSPSIDFRYVVLKVEKLTSALHLVTSFLNNSDPIKYKLRDQGLIVLQASLNFKYGDSLYKTASIDDLKRAIDTLLSYMSVALTDSSVSQMNLSILDKEYRDLYNYLGQYEANQESLVGKMEPIKTTPPLPASNHYPLVVKNQAGSNPQNSINIERQSLILSYIKDHSWSAINEITQAVPGVSSKTVQRELVVLVNEGKLKKKGDRRWARYNLADRQV